MKTSAIVSMGAGGLLLLGAGCISHNETVYRETQRVKVEFESDAAARVFYETLSKMPGPKNTSESTTEVAIPVIFEHKQRVVAGPNTAFNQAVSLCDTNQDGRITEAEARIFAEQQEKKK